MEITLKKRPKRPVIIEGFPGFGLVGTIASEFLVDHLKTVQIGNLRMHELPPMIAIHEGQVVEPIGVFYNPKHNIIVVHGVTGIAGLEWKITALIMKMAKDLNAKEVISIEGIGSSMDSAGDKTFFHTSDQKKAAKLKATGAEELKEGIIMGTTGIMMLRSSKDVPVTSIFAETHSELPDSKAAAKIIQVLDKYLGLDVDYKPLMKQAEKFESKLKELLHKGERVAEEQKQKRLSYVG